MSWRSLHIFHICEAPHSAKQNINFKKPAARIENLFIFAVLIIKKLKVMSLQIKETPILYGNDARRFLKRMKEKRTETPEQRAQRIADYESLIESFKNC